MNGRELQDGDLVFNTETRAIQRAENINRDTDYPQFRPIRIAVRFLLNYGFCPVNGKDYLLSFALSEDSNVTYFVSKTKIKNFNVRLNGYNIMECKVKYLHDIQHILRYCGLFYLAENLFKSCLEK